MTKRLSRARLPASALLGGLAILFLQGPASGQPASPKTAEGLFREARQLMDAKDYTAACPKFVESQKLEPAAGTLLNLADCYEKNGQTASAWSTFKDAAKAAAARNRADWVATANQRVASLEPKLATLAITVGAPTDVPGFRVERDGVVVERKMWGTAIPVDPGQHVLTASATGRKPWTRRMEVPATKNILVDVPPLETEAAAVPPVIVKKPIKEDPPPAEEGGSGMRVAGYVAMGVGVVGVAVGTITGLAALSKRSDAESKCEVYPSRCSGEAATANDDAKGFATISTISLIAGGVLVVGGLVLVLTSPKHADTKVGGLPFVLGGRF